jgi:hypothetical protein
MSIELKVKALSLAAESAIIRRQQRKLESARHRLGQWRANEAARKHRAALEANPTLEGAQEAQKIFDALEYTDLLNGNDATWMSLQHHRRQDVRRASRETHLARMFIAGTPYRAVEYKTYSEPNWDAVARLVRRYGQDVIPEGDLVKQAQVQSAARRFLDEWREVPPTNEMVAKAEQKREKSEIKFDFKEEAE